MRHIQQKQARVIAPRIKMLKDALESLYTSPTLPPRCPHDPRVEEIAMFPEVRAIIELPVETEVLPDTFIPVIRDLPVLNARWHSECKRVLGKNLRESYKELSRSVKDTEVDAWTETEIDNIGDVDLVDLAASAFECSICDAQMAFPRILAHRCRDPEEQIIFRESYVERIYVALAQVPWSVAWVRTKVANISKLHRVTSLLGLDWKTATSKDLDNHWFVCSCMRCKAQSPLEVMRWHCVVSSTWLYG